MMLKYFEATVGYNIEGTWQMSELLLQILMPQPPGWIEPAVDWKKVLFSDAVPPQPRTTEEKYTFKALSPIHCSNFVFASQMALLGFLPQFLSFTLS